MVLVAEECYELIPSKQFLNDVKIKTVLDMIRNNSEFQELVQNLGGFNLCAIAGT
ncbi:MAG: hypothetical protein GQ559_02415 [Desulfobulbaceae bacterium]|nr:hypothetical protein [Desulfobulbaceae bacterium]